MRQAVKQSDFATYTGDEGIMLRIAYIGTAEHYRVIAAQHTLAFYQGASVGALALDTGVSDGSTAAGTLTMTVATVDTCGELLEVINATTNWRAWLIHSMRGDLSDELVAATTTDSDVDVHFDQSARLISAGGANGLLELCFGIEAETCDHGSAFDRRSAGTAERTYAEPTHAPDASHTAPVASYPWEAMLNIPSSRMVESAVTRPDRCARVNTLLASVSGDTAELNVYRCGQAANTERLIYGPRTVANGTPLALTVDDLGPNLESAPGERIVVRLALAASATTGGLSGTGAYGFPGDEDGD
jgi:hypothetical protein